MLLTALEIIAFMVAASIVGVMLGWVLRGTLGNEQAEISDLRAQLRQLKKTNRESKAALAAANEVPSEQAADVSAKTFEVEGEGDKASAEISTAKASKPVARKKPAAKKKASAGSGKKAPARKSLDEREADQSAGQKAFADVVGRIGKAESDDNLTKIYGVGKKYATMLNDLGVSSYGQVSKLRKAEVRTLAAALGVLDDRLETEDWVASAKKLMKEAKK